MFYDSEIDPKKLATAEELNSAFEPWYFKIGDGYYRMTFDGSDKIRIINPCGGGEGDEEDIYRVVFQPVKAP